jgi:hypothetical protein
MCFSTSPTIRSDALAQVLSMGNVHAGARVLVVDTLGGVVVASVLERLAGSLAPSTHFQPMFWANPTAYILACV